MSFVAAPAGCHRGESFKRPSGEYEVYFAVRTDPDALRGVVAHEAQHLHDLHSEWDWSEVELEARAIQFARAWAS